MSTHYYPIFIEEHQEGGYHATCPQIQGAWADGETIDAVVENLKAIIKDIADYRENKPNKFKTQKQEGWHGLALAI